VKIAANTVVNCQRGRALRIEAANVVWQGKETFNCQGEKGGDGSAGADRSGWCVGEDQGNWANNFYNGGNEPGGDGGNGGNGGDGSDITILADGHLFAPGAEVAVNTKGGPGGQGGRGGKGRHKCTAPSGDDCRNGTRLRHCQDAPNGLPGATGFQGADGRVTIKGYSISGTPAVTVNGTKLTFPPSAPIPDVKGKK
jgi:hypothetical protein